MLHIIRTASDHPSLQNCLALAQPGDTILLIEEASYHSLPDTPLHTQLAQAHHQGILIYALQDEIIARGLTGKIVQHVQLIDYEGFVDLTITQPCSQSW